MAADRRSWQLYYHEQYHKLELKSYKNRKKTTENIWLQQNEN